ncbi:toxin ParE1/3/4 [Actimicrobium sp. GrIS 1.19]|nr:toxin ParE1/3/4 [Actimicrobium sp. GrIS 1.19]
MTYKVLFTSAATDDIQELKKYVIRTWSTQVWRTALGALKDSVDNLARYPHVGAVCADLAEIGIDQYRQLVVGPNYLIYEVDDANNVIYIHVVCDQRRDLQSLLLRRLLKGAPPAAML